MCCKARLERSGGMAELHRRQDPPVAKTCAQTHSPEGGGSSQYVCDGCDSRTPHTRGVISS
jgi:hypothetical protein